MKNNSLLHVKTKSYKEAVLFSGGSFTAYRRLLLHGGGSVYLANLGGSCLHGEGSWRPGVPLPYSFPFMIMPSFKKIIMIFVICSIIHVLLLKRNFQYNGKWLTHSGMFKPLSRQQWGRYRHISFLKSDEFWQIPKSARYRVSHETWQYAGRLECRLDFWYNLLRLFVNLILEVNF